MYTYIPILGFLFFPSPPSSRLQTIDKRMKEKKIKNNNRLPDQSFISSYEFRACAWVKMDDVVDKKKQNKNTGGTLSMMISICPRMEFF